MTQLDRDWFVAALDAMRDMVLIKGEHSKLLWANKAFLNYYGMSEEQLADIVDAPHSNPDDTLQYVIDDKAVFEGGKDLDVAREAVTAGDGSVQDFHTIKSPIFDEQGRVARTIGVSRSLLPDPTIQRAQTHEDAKAFAAPLTAITQNMPAPFMLLDVNGRMLNSSPAWRATFGDHETTPNAFFANQYPQLAELQDLIERVLVESDQSQMNIELVGDEGTKNFYDVSVSDWRFPSGTVGGVSIIANDVTELIHYGNSLRVANEELMQFSYRASHDLRAPLISMKQLTEFLIDDIRSGKVDESIANVERIGRLASRLAGTVAAVLDLHRAGAEEVEVSESFSLHSLIQEVTESVGWLLDESDCELKLELADELQIPGQRLRVQQILENLVSNSVKYRDESKAERWVILKAWQESEQLLIEVRDNGLGIPDQHHPDVMKMFKRFHPDHSSGTGLGLAIVKKHVDALKGSISFESTTAGTMFRVALPLKELL